MYIVTIINGDIETLVHGEKEKLQSGKIVKGINTIDSFTFSMFPNNAGFGLINEYNTLVRAYNTNKNRYEFMGRVLYPESEMSEDGLITKKVTCESLFGYLCDSQQKYVATRNWTVSGLLRHIINCHNSQVEDYKRFTVGKVTAKYANDNLYLGIQRENTWDAIKSKLIDKIGGELQFRVENGVTYIDYLDKIGEAKETEIAVSVNMKSVVREKDPTSLVTRLIPLGCKLEDSEERLDITSVNGGLDYIDNEEAKEVYGIRVGCVEFDDITTASGLLTAGRNWLKENNRVRIRYSISALDLSLIDLDFDDFDVGNYHPVKNALLDIDDNARIVKRSVDICDEVKSTIEVGDNFKTLWDMEIEERKAAAQNIAILIQTTKDLQDKVDKGSFFHVRYSAYADGTDMTEEPQDDTEYMGTCYSNSETAPTDKAAYTWCKVTGHEGDTGVGIADITTKFYLSTSKTEQTGGSWVDEMPEWSPGKYLWTKSIITYTDGSTSETEPICDSSWEAVDDLDKKLDADEVFNRLTNNGEIQGVFKEDGKLYINAEYIQALEKLFAKDITMTGKFTCTAETYLPPTYDDVIYTLLAAVFPDKYPLPEEYDFDLDGSGVFDKDDAIMAKKVYMGDIAMADCPGAQKTSATICIDMSNPQKLIHIYGYNMWGSYVETFISADANNSSFASKDYLRRMINQDSQNSNLYRTVDDETEYINPQMEADVEYRTADRYLGNPVYKKLDSATGRLLWKTANTDWSTYAKLIGVGDGNNSVTAYGAKGDGSTDDTAAFQSALAENRIVYVPGGDYVLSDTLVVRANCCLELSQDTVLRFTQTNKNAITMLRLANLKGNHATIFVPYAFSANVINCDTADDEAVLDQSNLANANATAVPPFTRWDPQWKMSRYVTDINICKPNANGFHYSNDGTCYGTAVYMGCSEGVADYMWGVSMSGLRIAGGFTYGIRLMSEGVTWNHDGRIEAVIDACETAVSVENTHYTRLAVTFQPRPAADGTAYSKHGFKLVDSRGIDLSSSRVWDWATKDANGNTINSKWEADNEFQHIALYGGCAGLILDDYLYHAQSTYDIRELIYTDTPSNLEKMTILQEPITRWFKPVDGVPYFSDGVNDKKLAMQADLDAHFETDVVKKFTDVLPAATDTDGTIYNGIGYKNGGYLNVDGTVISSAYYSVTGFIPITPGHTFYTKDMTLADADGYSRCCLYDENKNFLLIASLPTALKGNLPYFSCRELDDGFAATVNNVTSHPSSANVAYIRFSVWKKNVGDTPMVSIDDEIKYTVEGFLADGVKVKGDSVVLTSPGSKAFRLTVSDSGALTAEKLS